MRRSDIKKVVVTYADGSTTEWSDEIRIGHSATGVNMDGPVKGREEWDTLDVHISGPKRPLRQAQE